MSHTPKDSSFPEFLHKNLMSLSYKDLEFYLTRDKYKTNMLDYHISDLFSKGRKGKGEKLFVYVGITLETQNNIPLTFPHLQYLARIHHKASLKHLCSALQW